ncbi:MLV-related proviral Env polyprotein-like [Hyaena hyaena]|uniref:MLV-related proviral Env polyprotein-like n=1 Tax=Hyaena hyaena TaxID=95912 RepID=UPI001920F887|nr:MLV-related proviral Env polyprotein-like [Hyaena hyaena]XP_039110566.1 MLV-related proviral Env polyprotein-like [Hyaena hyaena]XP_039110567.1 MLV-related proviral Env polyprotein-like [Hyaena hyaena]
MERTLHHPVDHSNYLKSGQNSCLDSLHPRETCRPLPSPRKLYQPRGSTMETTPRQEKPTQATTLPSLIPRMRFLQTFTTLFLILVIPLTVCNAGPNPYPHNPHQPLNLTWVLIDTSTGDIIKQQSKVAPEHTWFPDFTFDLQDLTRNSHGGPSSSWLKKAYFYVCPGHKNTDQSWRQKCGGADYYYCASWACVSTGDIYWEAPTKDDLIQVKRNGTRPRDDYRVDSKWYNNCQRNQRCNPIILQFTQKGKSAPGWELGKTWGLYMYMTWGRGTGLPGSLFTLRLIKSPIFSSSPAAIGPNRILGSQNIPKITGLKNSTTPQPKPSSSPRITQKGLNHTTTPTRKAIPSPPIPNEAGSEPL